MEGLFDKTERLVQDVHAIVFSDYNKGALNEITKMIELGRYHKKPIIVDPKGTNFQKYKGATIITPNLSEFESVVGKSNDEQELINKGLGLVQDLSLDALLITRGEHGMTLIRSGSPELHLPARAQEVYDVTGAGDTVISVLAAAIASGESISDATALANIAAGLVVGKLGTAAISGPELRRAVLHEHDWGGGIMTAHQLSFAVQDAKEHGEKIVFTNGCFDLIHPGHISMLEKSRDLADRLVVGLNSDASVKRLKGPLRPIQEHDARAKVLASLSSVDLVIIFDGDTPIELIKAMKPEVLTKGADYAPDQVVGAEILKDYNGEVRLIELVEGQSTTSTVQKMLKN